ncbi:MAG: UvrD-helicase domain-containing protein [Cyanophyceae cyanobacterium]
MVSTPKIKSLSDNKSVELGGDRIARLAAETGLTEEQAAAAFALGSVAVTAGAGTGKTHMLAERYLFHLTERGLSPLEVVAVSFTRKAAAELRSRIRSKIAKTLGQDSEELAELEAAPISTFHSLAGRICREHPDAAGIPPNFQMMDELEGALWQQEQLDRAFSRLPSQVPELCQRIPYSKVREIFEVMLADPLAAQDALGRSRQDWLPVLEQLRQQTLEDLLGDPAWQNARGIVFGACNPSGGKLEEIRARVAEGLDDLEAGNNPEEIADAIHLILEGRMPGGKKPKQWDEALWIEVKEALNTIREAIKGIKKEGILTLSPNEYDDELEHLFPLLNQGFKWVSQCIEVAKKRSRILDFSDLEVYALRALEKREVREYYAERWHGFLVDEFQDTNPTQGLILERLVGDRLILNSLSPEPVWLTIVGDDKQAIYGFRGGDIEVFQQWRNRIESIGGDRVSLTKSFRTHGPLTSQINRIFKPILGTLHQDLNGVRKSPHEGPFCQAFYLFNSAKSTADEPKKVNKDTGCQTEIEKLAEYIQDLVNQKLKIFDKGLGKTRPIEYRDIAILGRTWKDLGGYARGLEGLEIPVFLGSAGNLLESIVVRDGIALLRFLADRRDNLALVALLRSPFFAISDRVLFQVAQQFKTPPMEPDMPGGERPQVRWWEELEALAAAEKLPEVLEPAIATLTHLRRERQRLSPVRLLLRADQLTGYTATWTHLNERDRRLADWQGFLDLLHKLDGHTGDTFAVVRQVQRLIDANSGFGGPAIPVESPPIEAGNTVQLMTLHASKGLEWPVVILPGLNGAGNKAAAAVYCDRALGVAWKFGDDNEGSEYRDAGYDPSAQPALLTLLRALEKQRNLAEMHRLYYVGLTRSRDRLILSGYSPAEKNSALEALQQPAENAGIGFRPYPCDPDGATNADPVNPTFPTPSPPPHRLLVGKGTAGLNDIPVTSLADYARCPRWFEYRVVAGHPGVATDDEGNFPQNDQPDSARYLGIVTHALLAHQSRLYKGFYDNNHPDPIAAVLENSDPQWLQLHAPALSEIGHQAAWKFAETFWTDPLFSPYRDFPAASEIPISHTVGPLTLNGIADWIGKDFILDFKTGRKDTACRDIDGWQVWAYARATGRSTGVLGYLRSPHLEIFTAEDLDTFDDRAEPLIQKIYHGDFAPTPAASTCTICPYSSLCDAAQDGIP